MGPIRFPIGKKHQTFYRQFARGNKVHAFDFFFFYYETFYYYKHREQQQLTDALHLFFCFSRVIYYLKKKHFERNLKCAHELYFKFIVNLARKC